MARAKKHYTAFKLWKIGEGGRDQAVNMVRDAWKYPGYKSAEMVREARSHVHSSPTHEGLRVTGAGVKFKKHMLANGFKLY